MRVDPRIMFVTVLLATVLVALSFATEEKAVDKYAEGPLIIKGSDTMVHVVTAWAEGFMKIRPEQEVTVTGGGSGTGISAMLNGTTGMCMASREVNAAELAL